MSPIARPESVGSRRGRRIAILLVVLLLIGLPLYLWPLHGGIEGLPGATALSGAPPDPRSAKAVAQLPADVWAELMGHGRPPAPSSGGPKVHDNLTRITPHEAGDGNGSLGSGGGPAAPGPRFTFAPAARTGRVALELEGATIEAGERVLLRDAELWLERGEHVTLVGPNGSGKTSLIETLAGRRPLPAGKLRRGHNVEVGFLSQHAEEVSRDGTALEAVQPVLKRHAVAVATRSRIGYLPENPSFYDYLTAEELLTYFAQLFGYAPAERRQRVAGLLDRVGIGRCRPVRARGDRDRDRASPRVERGGFD
jgi:hypothetical protein